MTADSRLLLDDRGPELVEVVAATWDSEDMLHALASLAGEQDWIRPHSAGWLPIRSGKR